jgi:hypothetical protein
MKIHHTHFAGCAVVLAGCILGGCKGSEEAKPKPVADSHDHPHEHGAGPHGGTVADWGGGKYHIEFTVDHDKKEAAVYVLGSDEKTLVPVKVAKGELLLTINQPAFQVVLKSAPEPGDPKGASAKYVGTDDRLGVVQEFAGTISGEVDGTPYAGDFQEEPHGADDH